MDVDSKLKTFKSGLVCRLCFSDGVEMHENQNAVELLQSCFCLQIVQDPKLPMRVCIDCSQRIIECQKFRNLCERSDTILKHLLYRENVVTIEDDEIDVHSKGEIVIEENSLKLESQTEESPSKEIINNKEGYTTDFEHRGTNYEVHYNGIEIIVTIPENSDSSCDTKVWDSPSHVLIPDYKRVLDEDTMDLTENELLTLTHRNTPILNNEVQNFPSNSNDENAETCHNTTPSHCNTVQDELPDLTSLLKQKYVGEKCKVHKKENCQPGCKDNTDLEDDDQEKESQKKKVPCRFCGAQFSNRFDVYVHMDIRHGDIQRTCRLCGKGFFTNESLAKHWYTCGINKAKNAYKCTVCGKICSGKGAIISHRKTHSLPFKCAPCKKGFMTELSLLKHYKEHQRRKNCEFCGKDFGNLFQLVKHRSTHVY